jgi:hypothetical protein
MQTPHFADLTLARRLERAEGQACLDFVQARAQVNPDVGAAWLEVGGTMAMFDGATSPLTQTFGLGIAESLTADDLSRIEEFFTQRGAPVYHEVSPLADASALDLLNARRYQPFEFTSVMHRRVDPGETASPNPKLDVRLIGADEYDAWAHTAADGWGEAPALREFMLGLSQVCAQRKNAASFLATLDGRPIATAALSLCDGVALFAGASTVPSGRKQGAQLALLDARLRYAAERGCDLAMMCALPGSASQRNAERQGFRIAYTRIKWRLATGH